MTLRLKNIMFHNSMIDEDIVITRLVQKQVMGFNDLCDYLSDGSTVTAADVAAVMKILEDRLPMILCMNAMVICTPGGLTFRPNISGSISQSKLKARLLSQQLKDPYHIIDVNRPLELSDLTTNDVKAGIAIDIPNEWMKKFQSKVKFVRV